MSSKPAVFFEAQAIPAAETVVYTSPASIASIVNKFGGVNTSTTAIQVTVKVVPQGVSAAASHVLVNTRTLLAGESYGFPEIVGQTLNPGDFISVLPSATGLNLRGSGVQVGV